MQLLELNLHDNTKSIKAAVATVAEATGGKLDYLVNNAGRNRYMPVLDEDLDVARRVFETSVWGAVAVIQGLRELVVSAKGVVGSVGGHCTVPYIGVYGASKRSLEIITKTLRIELAPFGSSLYKSIEEDIIVHATWNDGVSRGSAAKWADSVVGNITGGTPGLIWAGNHAGTMWLFEKVLPSWIFDKLMTMGQGLNKLEQKN
ncbi:hypothetical protein BJY00DRAFT_325137 [Aspergillus carlsbadensis]|nr:hypothetical protein BJY00DRAFT_325137 [Aspergillus carlsbadensis]